MIARVVVIIIGALIATATATAHAEPAPSDAVALLPLDADRSLEIYGQPVARAIAKALEDGRVPVVVVGAKMAVPERARLVVDGTLALGKQSAVTIALRIRSTADGKVLSTLSATAPGLAKIDVTAAELSARLLPIVQARLASLRAPASPPPLAGDDRPSAAQRPPAPAPDALVAFAIVDATRSSRASELVGALDVEMAAWTRAHHRQPRRIEAGKLDPKLASKLAAANSAELAIGFWIVGYQEETGGLPMARARVRVQIADANAVIFDRVIATDTVLGDKGSPPAVVAARVAREVLAILRPHVRRRVPSWS